MSEKKRRRSESPETSLQEKKRPRVYVVGGLPVELWGIVFAFLPKWYAIVIEKTCRGWRETNRPFPCVSRVIIKRLCTRAAKRGYLSVLQWLRDENGCSWDELTCAEAAGRGHLDVLRWLRQNGCPWNRHTCALAARGGHLNVLKYIRENGCDWDIHTCVCAAMGGHLDVLQWAREQDCPWNGPKCRTNAVIYGQRAVVEWIDQQQQQHKEFTFPIFQ